MKNIETMQYVFGYLFLVSNKLQTIGDTILEKLTLKQWLLLISVKNMDKKDPSVTEIAKFMGSTRQNIRKMITLLETKGYVLTHVKRDDRRNLEITLTPLTFDFFEEFEKKGNYFLVELFENISEDDLSTVNKVFQTLFNNSSKLGDLLKDI